MSREDIIRLGGGAFVVVTAETLSFGQDGYLLRAFDRAGLADATLRKGETALAFADRISRELMTSESGPMILAGGLIPCDEEGAPGLWKRDEAEKRRVEIFEQLKGDDRKLAIGLCGSVSAHFFERGIGRLHVLRDSSDATPAGRSSIFDPVKK